jgi:hypothetical protein
MTVKGKGMMIWQISRCESGDATKIAAVAKEAGFSYVLIKVAEATSAYNVDKTSGKDLVPAVVTALRAQGIGVWGWHYVYGYNPSGEASIAIQRTNEFNLDGYVIDAEAEYKLSGRATAAATYMDKLRAGIPNTPIALCSYRFPTYHPELPWSTFLNKCDYNMPQVYWQSAHNAGEQLARCYKEFKNISPYRPIMPTGPMYKVGDWEPTPADVVEFMDKARELEMSSVNYFEWYYGRTIMKPVWNAITGYDWSGSSTSTDTDITTQYLSALNSHNAALLAGLYYDKGVHITAEKTIQGTAAIQSWYLDFIVSKMPSATFTISNITGDDTSRHFTWTATSSSGKIKDGNDTFGLKDGKIVYHYSYYTITA